MSDEEIPMAQCGACNSIIPLDSESCPDCGVRFGEVSEQEMGECGACQAIIPADSTSCPSCGAVFIETEQISSAEEPIAEEPIIEEQESMPDESESEQIVDEENQEIEMDSSDLDEVESPTVYSATEEVDESPIYEEVEEETVEIQSAVVEEPTSQVEEGYEDEVEEVVAPEPDLDSSDEPQQTEAISEESANEDDEEDVSEDTVSEDETVESMMDDLVDDLEETDVDESEEVDAEPEGEKEPERLIEDSEVVMAFENLALAIAAKGMTAVEAFGEMDSSEDNLIDAPELQKGIEKIAGEKLVPKHVTAILNYLDSDGDRRVDPNELVKALDDLRIGIQPGELPKVKTFPSPVQKFLMGKKANDILYPISYFLMVTFIGIWVVNGMGLIVDGSGGTVVYEGGTDQWGGEITEANWNLCDSDAFDEMIDPCKGTVAVGDTYPCDPTLDTNKCQNSLTPFSGENGASSMPAGFYSDGIFIIILGVIGVAATAYLHLIYAPSLRERAKKGSNKEDDEEEEDEEDEEDSEGEDSGNALESPVDLEVADDEDEEDDSDEEEYDDDDIDVGDWIGLEVDGDEFFGEIIEFDDDEGTVTIETEDGEEITGDQEDMFLDDE